MEYRKLVWPAAALIVGSVAATGIGLGLQMGRMQPENLLEQYMGYIEEGNYEAMYEMLNDGSRETIDKESFIERNSNIYEGIEAKNIKLSQVEATENAGSKVDISYHLTMDTAAGTVEFDNQTTFSYTRRGYGVVWADSMIFPDLTDMDKVRISTDRARRGRILDRDGRVIAGPGTVYSVGIVPGKLVDREESLTKISELMNIEVSVIEKRLEADWVTAESFVPIGTISKYEELDQMKLGQEEEYSKADEKQRALTEIPGVMLQETEVRSYSLAESAAHLVGYVQAVTAEDIAEHEGEGYNANSVIGKTGMEGLYESELKGNDGCAISIVDYEGKTKKVIADMDAEDGEDIQLTIDADLQELLYEQFQEVRGCSVAMNPYTGEVLALVSTPAYDNNMFIKGLTEEEWTKLNEDEDKPMYNRFRQVWTPGSTFKPITAAIGLKEGVLDPDEDFGSAGLSWQKDSSWGDYFVTTLHDYSPVTMTNALTYSDNIYFAKAALRIGADRMMQSLDELGFNEPLPFEIKMSESQYSNTGQIETEIQLADSGYGQGQILINPLHLASIYTAFLNEGTILKPTLLYEENKAGEAWITDMFSAQDVEPVLAGLKQVVNDPEGTGYDAHREDIVLAGKTGTAEIKASKEDKDGSEVGWFAVFTTEQTMRQPILLVSMVEDVKNLDGSGYVVEKDKAVLDAYIK